MQILKDKIHVFRNGARQCFENDGFVCPVFVYASDGEIKIVGTEFTGIADKDQFAQFMADVIRDEGVTEYLTITEAWIATAGAIKDAEQGGNHYETLAEIPGREEAVVVVYCTPTSEMVCVAKIDRNGDRAVLGEWTCSERPVVAGGIAEEQCRFTGMFARAAGNNN